ncbi:MAG TPA: DUF1579 family protein [Thermoanaerobaculia bacterium]|nr:DUF1579 family protein [Thermoanaerobaculia bacterium]
MKTRMLAVVVCLITVAAFGQSNPKLKELQPFIGTWQCSGTTFASPQGPEHPTQATVTGTWTLGGTWLTMHYTETKTAKNPHPFDLIDMWSYDEHAKLFVSGFADNTGGYGTAQSPGWQGDKLVFTGPLHAGGMTMNTRDIFIKVSKNEIGHEGEFEDKGTWKKLDKEVCKR